MRYCAWLSELPADFASHPEAAGLARLTQAGLPVLPGWVVLPATAAHLFGHPETREAIRREAKLADRYPHAVSAAAHAVRGHVQAAPLPSHIRHELERMLMQLRKQLLLSDMPIRLRLRTDGTSIEREIADGAALALALKQLYSLQIEERHFLEKIPFKASEAFIQYVSTDEVSGVGHARDSLTGDDTVIQIVTGSQTFRIDRKSGTLLTAPAEREVTGLSESQLLGLARMIGQAQDAMGEMHAFGWQRLHGRLWLDGIRPLSQAQRSAPRKAFAAHSGTARGIARRIVTPADQKRLQSGEIAVVDSLRPTDHAWLSKAGAVVTAYGSQYGTPATLGRRLGIPVLTGLTSTELDSLQSGQLLSVDGHAGTIHAGDRLVGSAGLATKLIVTSDGLERAKESADGLLVTGTTGLLTLHALHPHEVLRRSRSGEYVELLADELQRSAAAINPKPLFYRFHDGYLPGGRRGLRTALERPEWLQVELRMLERAVRKAANIIPLTPLLHDLEEIGRLRRHAERYPELLRRLWVTCGTPAMTIQAEELGEGNVSGICLDLAHLAKLTLGALHDEAHSHLARPDHAAVLQQAEYLIGQAAQQGIATMIDTDGEPMSLALLRRTVTAGVDYLVVTEDSLQATERVVADTERHLFQEYRLEAAGSIC